MKHIKRTKLRLDRDVIRTIDSHELRSVAGGLIEAGTSGCSTPRRYCGNCFEE
jgi:hypothetical protein